MKKAYIVSTLTCILFVVAVYLGRFLLTNDNQKDFIKVGIIYEGDSITPYTENFIMSQEDIEQIYGEQIEVYAKYNIRGENLEKALKDLIRKKCDIIFTTSYEYCELTKEYAKQYPDIEFCQATGDNANTYPIYRNYHNFMGKIYEGRYVTGVVAGLKIKEMIDQGLITPEEAKVGYVAAFPYAEVISGYTAFILGVRSVVPEAVMCVKYTDSWNSFTEEKKAATELIDLGCIVISQHSDTTAPAIACESSERDIPVYHVGYNKSMTEIAPTRSLISCKINYTPYFESAIKALLDGKRIENVVDAEVKSMDSFAGFDKNWVRILDLNTTIAAPGTEEILEDTIENLKNGKTKVFKGDYIGVNPEDASDTIDLSKGYEENDDCSAPSFNYILKDVITILE